MKELFKIYIGSYQGLSRAAWLLAIVMLINRTGAMVLPFLGIYMSQALNFNIREVGIVLAFFGLGAVSGSWLGGWLTDKFGNFWVQALSLLLSVPLFLVVPFFQTVTSLCAIIYLLSLITESFRPANSVSVVRYAKPENITRAFSLNRMAMNLGFSVGPALGGLLATISYNWIFYGNAAAALIACGVFVYFFLNRKENPVAEKPKEDLAVPPVHAVSSPYRDGKFILFCILCFIYAVCFFQLLSTMPLFYQKGHALNEKQVGLILGFSGLVVVIFEMILVHIAEKRMSYASSIFIGTLLTSVSFFLLPIPTGFWILYLSIFVLSISEIYTFPFMASVIVKRAPRHLQGAYMGMNALAFSAAHIFSPYLGTRAADAFGFQPLWVGTGVILLAISFPFYQLTKKM